MIAHVRQLTDRNQHCEARIYVAREVLRAYDLTTWYEALRDVRDRQGYLTAKQLESQYQLDTQVLRPRLIVANLGHYYDAL